MIELGDRVIADKMPDDSHFKQVIGTVVYIRNGYVGISADMVKDRWSNIFVERENISVAAKIQDVIVL